jgi:anaerobic magnesium-protoporphyrin IX monomethyl ester cyclase
MNHGIAISSNTNKVLLFNPKSCDYNYRIPNSILSVAASIEGKFDYVIVDGNLEDDPYSTIAAYLDTGNFRYFGCTVMPGPQLKQAIPFTIRIKKEYPLVKTIWGGYFATNQHKVALQSGAVDFVINGPGDLAFPSLLAALENNESYQHIHSLIYVENGRIIKTPKDELLDQDSLPPLPYDKLHRFYPISKYLGKTFLGKRTIAYHSSIGCPFKCSFCAVVPIYEARWKGKSAEHIYKDIKYLKDEYDADAIEFHDNNFFVSEQRAVEFARLIEKENMHWWGEARIDTMDKYTDESLSLLRKSGCVMIFFGAESGNDEVLKKMDKGGRQSRQQILSFAARLRQFDIIPEYSFVLGTPAGTQKETEKQIDQEIEFIKEVKKVNPRTEIIIYIFSPVPSEGTDLYNEVIRQGFAFPEKLEDWLNPQWSNFDLRKNPLTPWLKPHMVDKIRNFETVLNGYYPTLSDHKLNATKRSILRLASSARYMSGFYSSPIEIKVLHKLWKYRQPETEGF